MLFFVLGIVSIPGPALADDSNAEPVLVVGTAPADAQSTPAADIAASHALTATDLLSAYVSSAFLSDTESNPFQEDLYYRGFDASPVLGTAEGLAIYLGGTRINQRFGDTVLWDTVPTFAIESIDVVPGSDPVFGLNALGGAIALNMKNGFDAPSGEQLDVAGGSYGRARAVVQMADQFGNEAVYLGVSAIDDSGWRLDSASQVYEAYGDYAVRSQRANAGVSLTLATDSLNENAAVPVQDSPVAPFAIPDTSKDRDFLLQGRGEYDFSSQFVLRGTTYLRATHIETQNGSASGFAPCASQPAHLCDDNGSPLETLGGAAIPSSVAGAGIDPIETIATTAFGASAETDRTGSLLGRANTLVIGDALDDAYTSFDSATLLGSLIYLPGGTDTQSSDIELGGPQYNVRLGTKNFDEGLYAQDTFALTSAISIELSGRYHFDSVDLTDRYGTSLTGNHNYSGVNPAVELVWQIADHIKAYAEFEQSSRTPTAAELSCANPTQPCLFPLSFISDPGLKQVVARTAEAGAGGNTDIGEVSLAWSADAFATRNQNDIIFESSGPFIGSGFFANIGATQRVGTDLSGDAEWNAFDLRASYGFVNATFESAYTDLSPDNPGANANGDIVVKPGDRMPNIPRSSAKLNLSYAETQSFRVAVGAQLESSQYLRGDEANLERPLPGYVVFNAEVDYQLTKNLAFYVDADNILDRRYATFGLYSDPTGNGAFPQFTNPRFIVPARPFGLWAGLRSEF